MGHTRVFSLTFKNILAALGFTGGECGSAAPLTVGHGHSIIYFINIVLHGLHSNSYAFRHFAVERFSSEPCISLQAISLITTAFHYLHWPFHYGYDAWCAKQVYGWSEVIHCVYLISYVVVYICILCISDILRSCVYLYIVYIWYLTSLPKLNKNKNSHCELSRSPLQC